METVDIVIASYGDVEHWRPFAERAIASAQAQTVKSSVFAYHNHQAHDPGTARNGSAVGTNADWLIFLDADDELSPTYVEEMLKGEGDIRQPSTLGVYPDGSEDDFPVLIPPHPGGFLVGNNLIIGCMVRRTLFETVGGFRDLPILEDWDFWIRCRLAGGVVGTCPGAIYRVHVEQGSRNMQSNHGQVYSEIQGRYQSAWTQRT